MGHHIRKSRSRAKDLPAFVFVDDTEGLSGGPRDEHARVLVRRQAARSGRKLLRTQHSGQGRNNVPGNVEPISMTLVVPNASGPIAAVPEEDDSVDHSIAPQPSLAGYEALRITYNFDITRLGGFSDVDLGKAAATPLQSHPTLVSSLLRQRATTFLDYLPNRYGASQCLDDAMHCLAARAGQMFGHQTRTATISTLYGKSLKSLQYALMNEKLCMGSDVYCATRLLTIYEMISPPEVNHWVLHNRGGMKLLELRGPANHQTKFDLMLLKSVVPSFLLDEIYRMRSSSILEAPAWQCLFKRASDTETDPDQSLWWELFRATCYATSIVTEMREIFTSSLPKSEYTARASKVLTKARYAHRMYHNGYARYQNSCPNILAPFDIPSTSESPDRTRLRGFYFFPRMQMCRAITTLSPDITERASREDEAQLSAEKALLIQEATTEMDPAMSWYFGRQNGFSHAVVQTRDEWAVYHELPWEEQRDILAQRWLRFHFSWRVEHLSESLEDESTPST